jgi:hypothetical protein
VANVVLPAGARNLTVPITVVPIGQVVSAFVYLASDVQGLSAVATGTSVGLPGGSAPSGVALPINAPSSGAGLSSWVVVYVNGAYWGTFPQTNTVTIGGVTVGQCTWS